MRLHRETLNRVGLLQPFSDLLELEYVLDRTGVLAVQCFGAGFAAVSFRLIPCKSAGAAKYKI